MTPEYAGQMCDHLNRALSGAESNLGSVVDLLVVVLREELWRERKIRTGEIVRHRSFLEMLTAPPLEGFGEDPKRVDKLVEPLLRDDPEALRLFRAATTASPGGDQRSEERQTNNDNVINGRQGNSRAYLLDRLHREAPELYERVVEKKLTAHGAAKQAGFIKTKTPLEQLRHWWARASDSERAAFLQSVETT